MMQNVQVSFAPGRSTRPAAEEPSYIDQNTSEWHIRMRTPAWRPPTDVFETEDAYVVRLEVAGMREEDFKVELDGRFLSIHGVRSEPSERRAYYQMEIRFGEFLVEIALPGPVATGEVLGDYQEGFLKVVLPKAYPRHIHIKE